MKRYNKDEDSQDTSADTGNYNDDGQMEKNTMKMDLHMMHQPR